MTTEATRKSTPASADRQSWGESAVRLANTLASEGFQRGDLAALRRMDPDSPDVSVFWRLLAQENLLGPPDVELKWALVLHGLALMTRTDGATVAARSAHDSGTPVGRALYEARDPGRQSAFYSESRLNRLLTARGPMLRTLLARMFRMVASADVRFNWYRMAELILADGFNESIAERVRRNIARDYFWAESRATRPSN